MASHMRTSLVCDAINMAVRNRPPHSRRRRSFTQTADRNTRCDQFSEHLRKYGILPSVGRTGVCWDNAWAESFNPTLKNERVHPHGVSHTRTRHQSMSRPG